jgi:hypothetical protein
MNDPHPSISLSPQASALALELAKILKLVAPASMDAEGQLSWLASAIDALEGIYANEVAVVSVEVRRSVTRPAQIVAKIAELVAEKRKRGKVAELSARGSMPERLVDYGNAHLSSIGRSDCHWIVRNGECVIEMV